MYTLYGFLNYPPLIDNTRDVVNRLGEISDDSLTYAKDKSFYTDSTYPQTALIGFHSVSDNVHTDAPEGLPKRCLQLGQWLYERAQGGQIGTSPSQLLNSMMSEFGDQIIDLTLGPLITSGQLRLPSWIQYSDTKVTDDNIIKLWLADTEFRGEYPEFFIDVIPPIDNIDDLFLGEERVRQEVNKYTLADRFQQVQESRGQYPYTLAKVEQYEWINPVDEESRVVTPWIVVIYGRAGNNPDLIKSAIVDYLLSNSDRPREDWEDLIPDLLLSTEFIFTPMWHQYALPNLELEAGIYSPIVRPQQARQITQAMVKGSNYTPEWIEENVEFAGVIYKSLAFTAVGNPNNRTGITLFSKQFPDYILVTNNSSDFNRMSTRTQAFKDLLSNLVKLAESTTPTTQVPVQYSRMTRQGIVYVGKQYENVLYLVATRYSVAEFVRQEGITA